MKFLLSAPADDPVMQMFLLLVSLLLLTSFWLLPFKYF
jgi:hypothetical protein